MTGILLAASALAILSPEAVVELERCGVVDAEAERLLALDWEEFDQDRTPGGWRAIAQREACYGAAADMIVLYLAASTSVPQPDTHGVSSLRWHAGQMRAMAGDVKAALAHFRGTYDLIDSASPPDGDWNSYVDATIAFLEGDRDALLAARERLAAQAIPPHLLAQREEALRENPSAQLPPLTPPFLRQTENLVACFGQPYVAALPGRCAR